MINFTSLNADRRERVLRSRLDRESRRVRKLGLRLEVARRCEAALRAQIADDARAQAERARLAVRDEFILRRVLDGAQ